MYVVLIDHVVYILLKALEFKSHDLIYLTNTILIEVIKINWISYMAVSCWHIDTDWLFDTTQLFVNYPI